MEKVTSFNISANTENKGIKQTLFFVKRVVNLELFFLNVEKTIRLSNLKCGII